jgi:site-specific recombinase XerD
LQLVGDEPADRAEMEVFAAMLDGWRAQQLSRNLSFATIDTGARVVRRFQDDARSFPWGWTAGDLEEWAGRLRVTDRRARSTVRSYELAVRSFLTYVCDPAYGWDRACMDRFGTHPTQICSAANLAAHAADYEGRPGRRSLTRAECQDLFDAADARVEAVRANGRKGWVPAFRDATMLKVAYGWGLRRRELLMLEDHDFGSNPQAAEFGRFGVCQVRWGKAAKGSEPRRRGVLTVMGWSVEVIGEWVNDIWPQVREPGGRGLWPSERGCRVSEDRVNAAFAAAAADAGLPVGQSPHCLRHSYVSHLIEDGFDALFVQQQVGHEHASTTAIYTSVSSDYRTRTLRAALDRAVDVTDEGGGGR